MEGKPSPFGLNGKKIVYGNPEINKTAVIFKSLMISSEPKPRDLQSLAPGIRTQPPASTEVADTGPHKKITMEQPRDCYRTPSTMRSQEHISEGQRRFLEVRKYKKEKRQKDMMRANVKKTKEKKKKKKKKMMISTRVVDLKKQRVIKNERRMGQGPHGGEWVAKRLSVVDLVGHSSSFKVRLSNILQYITNNLCENKAISYLFQKPVTIKEAPDYFDIVKQPMDLSTIIGKVHKMEYKSHKEFRHDVLQIALNAHQYNVGRNPHIPPLADRLLEFCDHLLEQYKGELEEAEAGIEVTDC